MVLVRRHRRRALGLATAVLALTAAGCTSDPEPDTTDPLPSPSSSRPSSTTSEPPPTRSPRHRPPEPASANDVTVETAWAAVTHLADEIGPRHGTSPAFRRAATWVTEQFRAQGYDVRRQPFDAPAGVSWGVPVPAGESVNVIATFGEVDLRRPHLVVGAHLDTVPQAPGAEDNASGIGALLAAAEAVVGHRTRLPVVFVAFGAEEPRGPSDDEHHYGSRAYVDALGTDERAAVRGMLSLDRVGVGGVLPVCSASDTPDRHRAEVLAAAERAGVATLACTGNRSSDHWSFVRNGLPGTRLGSTSYAAYHSAADVPSVVNRAQLGRAARTTVSWLATH